jgi:predicted nucleotidyltransferase
MSLPKFTPAIADEMRQIIETRISEIEAGHDVKVSFAIESGSRAWGFPSPDSDYDVRFVYARPVDWYLGILPERDVIELPISGDLDINGWDIQKALGLLIKPNPVLLEWLSSPIRYSWDDEVCAKLIAFSRKTAHAPACLYHYRHLGDSQWAKHVGDKTEVNLKKYFYVLRPALAIRWIRLHPETAPPMNLQALVEGLEIDETTEEEIARLLDMKSRAKEIGLGPRITGIDQLIAEELDWAREAGVRSDWRNLVGEANALFQWIVKVVSND